MLSFSHFTPTLFPSIHQFAMDGTGTIDPAALNSSGPSNPHIQMSPRGIKRSRSPEEYGNTVVGEDEDGDDSKPRKRGRPPKIKGVDSPHPASHQPLTPATPSNTQTPHIKTQHGQQMSPSQSSPQRTTPTSGGKQPVVKALPTVRDHTTDQLNPEGDEYVPREKDDNGETKVDANGYLADRKYRIRTFILPNRAEKLFMLATECARVLSYRDSYLLFNKNRSLFKIIASQEEKDNLISQEILPYSYRSRQIAIVTARSMFRQFGSRVIMDGRRVRDDYWESKARKQGFTEDDAAGEKRPGAAKQREAAAAEAHANTLTALPHGEIIYSSAHGMNGQPQVPPGIHPVTLTNIPMIDSMSPQDISPQDFGHIIRPRQEISGPAYQDRTQPCGPGDLLSQTGSSAEFNKQLTQQRAIRSKYLDDYWKRPHEIPTSTAAAQLGADLDAGTIAPQHLQSPQATVNMASMNAHQNMLSQQQNTHMMPQQTYQQHQQPQHSQQHQNLVDQSPVRSMHQSLPSSQMHLNSPVMNMSTMSGRQQTPSYNFQPGGMWPPPQPQHSPHPMQFGQQQQTPGSQQSPMHPPAQLPHGSSNMGFGGMGTMPTSGYGAVSRNMYQASPSPQQHFGQQGNVQGAMQGWGQQQNNTMGAAGWQRGF